MNARTRLSTWGAVALSVSVVLTGCSTGGSGGSDDGTSLSVYIDSAPSSIETWEALSAAYAEVNPDVKVTIEAHPPGSEGDNLIKTRLATGEMNDMFWYNSGSLFQALKADQNLVPLTDEPWAEKIDENFKKVVSTDTALYGAPVGPSFAGAVIYNKEIYADLGLEVPATWDEFMANNEAIKQSGLVAVVQTYGDTWTSQVPVLGDFSNVEKAQPGWAEAYTAGDAKFADQPALAGFEHLQALADAQVLNQDFASATYDDGVRMLATGEAAHYPMLTNNVTVAIGENYPEAMDTLGVFPMPRPTPRPTPG